MPFAPQKRRLPRTPFGGKADFGETGRSAFVDVEHTGREAVQRQRAKGVGRKQMQRACPQPLAQFLGGENADRDIGAGVPRTQAVQAQRTDHLAAMFDDPGQRFNQLRFIPAFGQRLGHHRHGVQLCPEHVVDLGRVSKLEPGVDVTVFGRAQTDGAIAQLGAV